MEHKVKHKVEYYFKEKDEFPFPQLFEVETVLSIFEKRNELLSSFKEPRIEGEVGKNVHIEGVVIVEKGAKVLDGTHIIGPAYIGENSRIGPNAYIRPYTIIGKNCQVGSREIKASILMNNVEVNHHGYIGDSILGHKAHFGAGASVANLRFDGKEILPGRRKLGAIVGDGVQVGVNATLTPGTFVGANSWIYPGIGVKGFVPSNSILKWKPQYEIAEKR